jgi:maleamate amidohydrolase
MAARPSCERVTAVAIWDAFLSEQDRAVLALDPPVPRVRPGERAALLLVDNWQSMLGEYRLPVLESARRWHRTLGAPAWDAVDNIRTLLAAARSLGLPVVHTTMGGSASDWFSATRGDGAARDRLRGEADARDPYELVESLRPADGEVLLTKTAPSGFWGTPLVSVLQRDRVDTIVVCGATTSGCVRATVVDAASHGLSVLVPADCVYDRHEASHAISLFDMDQRYADVVPMAEALTRMTRMAGRAGPSA